MIVLVSSTFLVSAATTTQSNIFKLSQVKVGSKVAGMKISYIRPFLSDVQVSYTNAIVRFFGNVNLTGKYYQAKNPAITCFDVTGTTSVKLLPREKSETKIPSFCFSNQDLAKKLLGPVGSQGTATIQINQYDLYLSNTATTNGAQLTKVYSKKATSVKK